MKIDVEYCIESNLRSEIIKVKNVCMEILNNPEVYIELTRDISFEQAIYKDLIDIRMW